MTDKKPSRYRFWASEAQLLYDKTVSRLRVAMEVPDGAQTPEEIDRAAQEQAQNKHNELEQHARTHGIKAR